MLPCLIFYSMNRVVLTGYQAFKITTRGWCRHFMVLGVQSLRGSPDSGLHLGIRRLRAFR